MKNLLLLAIFTTLFNVSYSQTEIISNNLSYHKNLDWTSPISVKGIDENTITLLHFSEAAYNFPFDSLPMFSKTTYLPGNANDAVIEVNIIASEPLTAEEKNSLINSQISSQITPEAVVSWYRKRPIVTARFYPVFEDPFTKEIKKVTEFSLEITPKTNRAPSGTQMDFKVNSVLRSGYWVKVGVTKDGIYKVSYDDLKTMGFNTSDLSSNSVRLFGNGGGYLPFDNAKPRFDDLEENAIEIVDGGDGKFGSGDYLLFYGQNQHRWKYSNNRFNHVVNFFADTTYYFITTDYQLGQPKRVSAEATISQPADVTINTFTDFQYHEVDLLNFVKSGRNWYGESYNFKKDQSFLFSFPNIVPNTAQIKSTVAFRVIRRPAKFTFSIGGTQVLELNQGGINGGYYDQYAALVTGVNDFNATSDNITVNTSFKNPSTSDNAWLDFIEIITDRKLINVGNQMPFRSAESKSASIIQYNIGNSSGYRVWDVTTPTNVQEAIVSNGSIKAYGGKVNEFISFNNSGFLSVKNFGVIVNQDLHAVRQADYVIVTHPRFIKQANQLADYHRKNSNLTTTVVTTQQLYNEYSSGAQDITAIKSFNKMLYDRAGTDPNKMLKYVLLLGDASYDYKYRFADNTNDIPAYQSWNSYHNLGSYITDDYVGFLDDNESDELSSTLDIGIGRIMAHTESQAQDIVDKTINYMTNPDCMRPWRNWVTYIGDDEDYKIHMIQSDHLATKVDTTYDNYNINKIYLDAYQQVSNAGGSTYPDVNTAIDQATEKGNLMINYVGHGGELGLANERILGLTQINGYTNFNSLPLYITATCEFSRFDDPERTSAGEFMLLNPNGGSVALLTTTRLVYSSPNFELSKKFFNVAFEKLDGEWPRLGDLLRISKIGGTNINYRNFSLLGDPAATLAYPTYTVATTTIPDTVKSLQKVTISGMITDENNQKVANYNGVVYPTVFGQRRVQKTLNNDGFGAFGYETQTNALFNGKASVANGEFTFSFIVPKDIDFKYGTGKISFYAENSKLDASGHYENFLLGGRIDNPAEDNVGPTVNLWMNDESFIIGGLTDQNPLIYAKIYDENGINTVGSGIGHDIVAVIDENTANSLTLNEYYEAELDSYQKGSISYALSNLSEGKHTLRLKAWDVYNNSGEAYTEFVVSNSGDFKIEHVLNYPNPFTTNTDFYFDHNAIGQQLTIRIQVFTVSGKLVKTIDLLEQSDSYKVGPINWDGRDDYGDRIGKGTYIYKVKVTNSFGQTVEKFEKIVIL